MYISDIMKTEKNVADSLYWATTNGVFISGGVYIDTGLPCKLGWLYSVVDGKLQSVQSDIENCVIGDSINNTIKDCCYVLNYRVYGDEYDRDSMYYSGKARTMINMDTAQNSTELYSVDNTNDYKLELALRDS